LRRLLPFFIAAALVLVAGANAWDVELSEVAPARHPSFALAHGRA
jgi:hypothetical protein